MRVSLELCSEIRWTSSSSDWNSVLMVARSSVSSVPLAACMASSRIRLRMLLTSFREPSAV